MLNQIYHRNVFNRGVRTAFFNGGWGSGKRPDKPNVFAFRKFQETQAHKRNRHFRIMMHDV